MLQILLPPIFRSLVSTLGQHLLIVPDLPKFTCLFVVATPRFLVFRNSLMSFSIVFDHPNERWRNSSACKQTRRSCYV